MYGALTGNWCRCAMTLGVIASSAWILSAWFAVKIASGLDEANAQAAFITMPNLTPEEVRAIREKTVQDRLILLRPSKTGLALSLGAAVPLSVISLILA